MTPDAGMLVTIAGSFMRSCQQRVPFLILILADAGRLLDRLDFCAVHASVCLLELGFLQVVPCQSLHAGGHAQIARCLYPSHSCVSFGRHRYRYAHVSCADRFQSILGRVVNHAAPYAVFFQSHFVAPELQVNIWQEYVRYRS